MAQHAHVSEFKWSRARFTPNIYTVQNNLSHIAAAYLLLFQYKHLLLLIVDKKKKVEVVIHQGVLYLLIASSSSVLCGDFRISKWLTV